ncbi:ssl3692 [Synechocystis sp. PCC 6803]|uniref:Ssl3692 protein n=1 Tax=Synechocystis sp. (strain ATCC 27184 / PCC 6803 / Kazusa) TaxID=1111708 RepID=P73815_SYNY3|nr:MULTISPECIES: DUF2442 domain-containing protein [unclassified Synechocystis]BAM51622.1 hypothetical protein BEST7613_2691 [Synechocystis sp. PCC 6803] [Bacillus subtilis BEST7613]AGF51557.1 hypothetical protein MYO_113050 [Synechocystis sp. PCC 6803]ALJ67553.1 hypothetical protein AOY38_06680 [Synechocystis sp. PCC 6803]AVP89398.1 DUF2442 domain-containing protein [Synechocystis sp. IPPAS B-1465]MBD2618518.1 DUF2442 domain-containing protein [Synechocystis sp. FACHB-898]
MNSQVKTPWLKAISVFPLDNFQLQIKLENGQELILDLQTIIETNDNYWRLKNPRYFRQAQIDPLGGIAWPEGEDLSPTGLERYAKIAFPSTINDGLMS